MRYFESGAPEHGGPDQKTRPRPAPESPTAILNPVLGLTRTQPACLGRIKQMFGRQKQNPHRGAKRPTEAVTPFCTPVAPVCADRRPRRQPKHGRTPLPARPHHASAGGFFHHENGTMKRVKQIRPPRRRGFLGWSRGAASPVRRVEVTPEVERAAVEALSRCGEPEDNARRWRRWTHTRDMEAATALCLTPSGPINVT